ncbi:MAG: hypothetical protein HYY24_19355 [Verrucomicrobia bacterium]|nr:hypothetical protein [Verrucomicrobiota bacterium]
MKLCATKMPTEQPSKNYPTAAEFKQLLLTQPLEEIVKARIFAGVPYAFSKRPQAMDTLRNHLSNQLRIPPENVIVIGSAKIGFSLSPDNFPRAYSRRSDIDVLLVHPAMFDSVWKTLLAWHYPRRSSLDGVDWDWARHRRDEIYWGWLEPSRVRYDGLSFPDVLHPMRNLSAAWFGAFRSLARYPDFMGRDVSGRLYRTWDHALAYQVAALKKIKALIQDWE